MTETAVQTSNPDLQIPTRRMTFDEAIQTVPKHFAKDGDLDRRATSPPACPPCFPTAKTSSSTSVRHFRDQITDPASSARSPASLVRSRCTAASTACSTPASPSSATRPCRSRSSRKFGLDAALEVRAEEVEPRHDRRARALHRDAGRDDPQRRRRPRHVRRRDRQEPVPLARARRGRAQGRRRSTSTRLSAAASACACGR